MDYSVTTDLTLQVEVYLSMLSEQEGKDRHEAFVSCGIISRVTKLLLN